jgi:hypothetical protein
MFKAIAFLCVVIVSFLVGRAELSGLSNLLEKLYPVYKRELPLDVLSENCGDLSEKGTYDNPWPWVVSIQVASSNRSILGHTCGGALISNDSVLTAAHCLNSYSPSDLVVIAGSNNLDAAVHNKERIYDVAGLHVHSDYNSQTVENDIALIRLARPIVFDADVSAICVPLSSQKRAIYDKSLIMAGW